MQQSVIFIFLCFFFFIPALPGQSGCTDPQATNYDPVAQTNDGSCQYPTTNYQLSFISNLPKQVRETSGLAYIDNQLITINDAGNPTKLYQLDTAEGTVRRSWYLRRTVNLDWEDLAQDEQYLYIGDFGNNDGNRRDLQILRINKLELNSDTLTADTITFRYEDQINFTPRRNNHNFDCEAFIAVGDSLYLFSKNWVDRKTRLYALPAQPGEQLAVLRDSFDVNGWITAAARDDSGVIVLLGYTELSNFMWLLFDYPETRFFAGNKRLINLGNPLTNSQTEGIVFRERGKGYVSAEALTVLGSTISQRFFEFETQQWTNSVISGIVSEAEPGIRCFPNPFTDKIELEWKDLLPDMKVQLMNVQGKVLQEWTWENTRLMIPTGELATGAYWLIVWKNDETIFKKKVLKF